MPRQASTAAVFFVAVGLAAQTAQTTPARPARARVKATPVLEIYQVDLEPTGTIFALSRPSLEGDKYVFRAYPERDLVHLDRAKVRSITQRTKDLSKEVVYRIDLVPKGQLVAGDLPVEKGDTFVFHTYREGTLMSVRKADVSGILKLTGLSAFKLQQEQRGAAQIGDLAMEGGTATVLPAPGEAAPARQPLPQGSAWIYHGMPGVSDGYAPAPSTVSSPGDVPRAPTHVPR